MGYIRSMCQNLSILDESGTDEAAFYREVGGGLQVLLGFWLMLRYAA